MQKYLLNPPMKVAVFAGLVPGLVILETTGRVTRNPRRTVVGVYQDGAVLWAVAEHGRRAGYVRNLSAEPRVRVRLRGRWRPGSATVVPGDDPQQRLECFPRSHRQAVRTFGTDLLSIRIELRDA